MKAFVYTALLATASAQEVGQADVTCTVPDGDDSWTEWDYKVEYGFEAPDFDTCVTQLTYENIDVEANDVCVVGITSSEDGVEYVCLAYWALTSEADIRAAAPTDDATLSYVAIMKWATVKQEDWVEPEPEPEEEPEEEDDEEDDEEEEEFSMRNTFSALAAATAAFVAL